MAEVTLNIYQSNLESGIGLLKALVDDDKTNSSISRYIRTIYIDSLSPSFSPVSDGSWVYNQAEFIPISVTVSERALSELLKPALLSLHNLNTVR